MEHNTIDFDSSDAWKFFRPAMDAATAHQQVFDAQEERDYQNFHAFVDMTYRNPDKSNVVIPKIWSIVMTKAPKEVRAAIGKRPYIPFGATNPQYKWAAEQQSKMLDYHLAKGGFFNKFTLGVYMKILMGTAFMDAVPYFEEDMQAFAVPHWSQGPFGPELADVTVMRMPVKRLRLKITTYGRWEVRYDPWATGLECADECRYVIKTKIASKRALIKLAESSPETYNKLDLQELIDSKGVWTSGANDNRGIQILQSMGITQDNKDGDIGVLFQLESPDRYMQIWNDDIILQDIDNPYSKREGGHNLINLSRMIHGVDPHTLGQFTGNGEGKIQEQLQALMSDTVNHAMDSAQFMNVGMTYYLKGRGVGPNQLVATVGNQVGFEPKHQNEKIQDIVFPYRGQSLPSDHYKQPALFEGYSDLAAGDHGVQRGEEMKGAQTLGEISMLKEAGDSRNELSVRMLEYPFMADFGKKCLCHIDQFARYADKREVLGDESAMAMMLMNPSDLPGGYDFQFKGSDKVMTQLIKQRNYRELNDAHMNNPMVRQDVWLRRLDEAHDIDDVDELIKSPQEVAMEQAQQMQMDQANQVFQARVDVAKQTETSKGDKEPSTKKTAQKDGREYTKGVTS